MVLSNINAGNEKWDHAAAVRKAMVHAGIQKTPAYCMIMLDIISKTTGMSLKTNSYLDLKCTLIAVGRVDYVRLICFRFISIFFLRLSV